MRKERFGVLVREIKEAVQEAGGRRFNSVSADLLALPFLSEIIAFSLGGGEHRVERATTHLELRGYVARIQLSTTRQAK